MDHLNLEEEYCKIPEQARMAVDESIARSKQVYGERWQLEFFNNFGLNLPSKGGYEQHCSERVVQSIDTIIDELGMTREHVGGLRDDWQHKGRTQETSQLFFVIYYRLLQKGYNEDEFAF